MTSSQPLVYVIAAPGVSPGRVQVGHTAKDPADVLRDLQAGSPVKLEVVYTTEGNHATQHLLHVLFAARRTHGGWFEFGDTDPVAEVAGAVQLLREAAQPYDAGRRMARTPASETPQVRYQERRDAVITALVTYGPMGHNETARRSGITEGTFRRVKARMVAEGILDVAAPGRTYDGHTLSLNMQHPEVLTLLHPPSSH